jgi:hypothetical protein
MRAQKTLCFAVFLFAVFLSACGGSAPIPNASKGNANVTNTNTSTNPLETHKNEPEVVTNNAPTLTPVFKAFCAAWAKNDEKALRNVYSQDTIKFFEGQMKQEKSTSLIKFLQATDKVSGDPCDVTNEKIEGDKAVGTIHSDKYPRGIKVVFVKENGEWKMTNKSPDLDIKKPETAANSTQ